MNIKKIREGLVKKHTQKVLDKFRNSDDDSIIHLTKEAYLELKEYFQLKCELLMVR